MENSLTKKNPVDNQSENKKFFSEEEMDMLRAMFLTYNDTVRAASSNLPIMCEGDIQHHMKHLKMLDLHLNKITDLFRKIYGLNKD